MYIIRSHFTEIKIFFFNRMEVISSFIIFSVRREREKQQRRNRKIKETTGRPGREVLGGTGFVFSELRICV